MNTNIKDPSTDGGQPADTDRPDGLTKAEADKIVEIMNKNNQGKMALIVIGIEDTPHGTDYWCVVNGERETLKDARVHLIPLVDRAMSRKGPQ